MSQAFSIIRSDLIALSLTATAIAERVGLHASNVSRTLRVLIEAGYVRKATYHSVAADLGLFALVGHSLRSLPVVTRTAAAIRLERSNWHPQHGN